MNFLRPVGLVAALLCAACAQQPRQPEPVHVAAPAESKAKPKVAVVKKPARHQPPLPHVELSEQLMFKLMLAEVAMQRGQPQIAVPAYLDLARETKDPRIAQRATEIAWNARMLPSALEAAGLWLQADPESPQARQILAALLVNQSQLADAKPHLEKWLAADPANIGASFLQLSKLLARHKDRQAVLQLLQSLAQPYPQVPEARLAVAQAAWTAGAQQIALDESLAALKLKPDWELAALFHAQALQRRSDADAASFLADYLKSHPQARDARLTYARLLVASKRYDEARKEFETLLAAQPGNGDLTMAVALLSVQARDYDMAETLFKRVLQSDYKDPDAARLYLGQLYEERKRYDDALQAYSTVHQGEHYINAQARYAGVLAKQGKLQEARDHLHGVSAQNNQQRVQLTEAEAQLLREANKYQEAYDILGRALTEMPNYPDLLYDHAMAAEKVQRYDVLEADLRKLIEIRPDHAHAYNALGYTLADRNERLPEARSLIETALNLAPEDPFILDSMGWVLFRMGQNKEALDYLQRAFVQRPDPEIAAHLGEVLWTDGQQEEARKVWSEGLKQDSKNQLLQNTVRRFAPLILPAAR